MTTETAGGISLIADRYAYAMFELAERQEMFDRFSEDLFLVKKTLQDNRELEEFIEHPLIIIEDKKEILNNVFKDNVSEYVINLLMLLADKNRLIILKVLAEHYYQILCKRRNITTAEVITAIKVEDSVLERVKLRLENITNRQVLIKSTVDDEIIAGMIIKFDDKIIDGSIKTKLESMKKQLI